MLTALRLTSRAITRVYAVTRTRTPWWLVRFHGWVLRRIPARTMADALDGPPAFARGDTSSQWTLSWDKTAHRWIEHPPGT